MSMMTSQLMENKRNPASGDHELIRSDSGVELKSLLKLIDNVIEMAPATDEPEDTVTSNSIPSFSMPPPLVMPSALQCMDPMVGYVTLSETLMVPVKKFPKYNFVGRILGPRGMTVKQLEKETGCKIFVRGRASNSVSNPASKVNRLAPKISNNNPNHPSRPSLSNISKCSLTEDPLHVYIECYDLPESGAQKMANAVAIIKDLLSPPADGKDELKRQQLVDISLINGTYRATSASSEIVRQFRRAPFRQTVDPTSNPIQDLELEPLQMDIDGNAQIGGSASHADLGSVYGIAQQRRVWQKPRGPDTLSEEYAKSVSSREFVSDIVNKTKKSPVKNQSNDSLFQLPDTVVNKTLKVAQNLLASHKHLAFGIHEQHHKTAAMHHGAGDFPQLPDFSVPPPPLHSLPHHQYNPYQEYPHMYYMYTQPQQSYHPDYSHHY
ncbi:hypothetical protein CAEBREN_02761 [Caenorhabditis brenneri]|uniref:K Homology domain-containing protein n=1 Tax=Caenorhabditis brenneri TaxID=135651 RepID=G0MZX6_CAEBE|nr:hypothetical protein CAEBREN_02761 [Caenorhabditis brenneri]